MTAFDHGALNLPLHKRGHGTLDQQIDRGLREIAKANARRQSEIKAARKACVLAEAQRVRFTPAGLEGATLVRDSTQWYNVRKVNTKSVSVVPTMANMLTERVAIDRILEARWAAKSA